MPRKRAPDAPQNRRITVALDPDRYAILEGAKPIDGSMSDALRAVIDIACRADEIERQNRDLTAALTVAMQEMGLTLTEIRAQVVRLEGPK